MKDLDPTFWLMESVVSPSISDGWELEVQFHNPWGLLVILFPESPLDTNLLHDAHMDYLIQQAHRRSNLPPSKIPNEWVFQESLKYLRICITTSLRSPVLVSQFQQIKSA